MFCRNCGKDIDSNVKFCNHCGASTGTIEYGSTMVQNSTDVEITSLQVDVADESEVIAMHQKFGWRFLSTQEINTSYTDVHSNYIGNGQTTVTSTVYTNNYIKLTFERDRNMPNYSILRDKYDEYISLYNEIKVLRASKDKRNKEFYFVCGVLGLIGMLIGFFAIKPITDDIDAPFLAWLFALIVGLVVFAFSAAIGSAITGPEVKRKIEERSNELRSRMYTLASDAQKYLV